MFQTGDDFDTGGGSLNNHRMMYSYDQTNWLFFDNNNRTVADVFTFTTTRLSLRTRCMWPMGRRIRISAR